MTLMKNSIVLILPVLILRNSCTFKVKFRIKDLQAMAHELTGKVLQVLPEQTGTGRNGQWSRQDFIVETQEQYPRKVCFSAWGDKVAQLKSFKPDDFVKVFFNIESRDYNGRWYTDLRIWKIETSGQADAQANEKFIAPGIPDDLQPLEAGDSAGEKDDLPF